MNWPPRRGGLFCCLGFVWWYSELGQLCPRLTGVIFLAVTGLFLCMPVVMARAGYYQADARIGAKEEAKSGFVIGASNQVFVDDVAEKREPLILLVHGFPHLVGHLHLELERAIGNGERFASNQVLGLGKLRLLILRLCGVLFAIGVREVDNAASGYFSGGPPVVLGSTIDGSLAGNLSVYVKLNKNPRSLGVCNRLSIEQGGVGGLFSSNRIFLSEAELLRVPLIDNLLFSRFFEAFYSLFKVATSFSSFREFQLFGGNVGLFVGNSRLPVVDVGLSVHRLPLKDGYPRQNASEYRNQNGIPDGPPFSRRFIFVWSSGLLLILACYFGGKLIDGGRQISASLLIVTCLLLLWFGLFLICVSGFSWSWGWWL